jgi:hypothetical protein
LGDGWRPDNDATNHALVSSDPVSWNVKGSGREHGILGGLDLGNG